ncbi:MAG: GNAT family N-acetyltransferase [Candidatus Margulisbacteria bacterium]|nr:GNAT family N-acetyltransferase [Candidatus Margulisiibacteriota bacterium]
MTKLTYQRLSASHIQHLHPIAAHIEKHWPHNPDDFKAAFFVENTGKAIAEGKLDGYMLFKNDSPIGIGWVEFSFGRYGLISCYTCDLGFERTLARYVLELVENKDVVLELIHFGETGDVYRDAIKNQGFMEQKRERLYFEYPIEPLFELGPPNGKAITPLTKEHTSLSSDISFPAHQSSQDLKYNSDFFTLEKRSALEKDIFNGMFGEIIPEGTLKLEVDGVPVGICTITGLPAWGYDKIGWVTDISILPEYHGKGYGKYMLKASLNAMSSIDIPYVGLAVSDNNPIARKLYEKLGFVPFQTFYEYGNPD